jgi:hypothetical protein
MCEVEMIGTVAGLRFGLPTTLTQTTTQTLRGSLSDKQFVNKRGPAF